MDKRTGTIITVVVAVLTLCCSVACCGLGIGNWVSEGGVFGSEIDPAYIGIPAICLAILVWIVPLLLWIFLVRRQSAPSQ